MIHAFLFSAYFSNDPHHAECRAFIGELKKESRPFTSSIFALAEVLSFVTRNSSVEYARQIFSELAEIPNLRIAYFEGTREFQDSILTTSLTTGLSGSDALHYIQALSTPEVDEIVTLDHDFKRVSDKIKVTFLGR